MDWGEGEARIGTTLVESCLSLCDYCRLTVGYSTLIDIICHTQTDGRKHGPKNRRKHTYMDGKTDKPDKLQGITPCVNQTSYRV